MAQVRIDASNASFIERPAAFKCSAYGQAKQSPVGGVCQEVSDMRLYQYAPQQVAADLRVSYASSKYPWLEAVHRFKQVNKWPKAFDIARFAIDARKGAGQYVVHYVWRGYRDCIDVRAQRLEPRLAKD